MLRIGVMGTANIAKTRMIPTILKTEGLTYAGTAVASDTEWDRPAEEEAYLAAAKRQQELSQEFLDSFGGEIFPGYMAMLEREDIDIVYLPLPPSLHYRWGLEALKHGKHVLMEKPFTLSVSDTEELLKLAEQKHLSVIENYGFPYHAQFAKIRELLRDGKIGDLRLVRTAFGFPHRAADDFRYSRHFGGGALFDCGGYTLKMATQFLEGNIQLLAPSLITTPGHEVDISGSATLTDGKTFVQLAFGMDHAYKCELECWGSTATLLAPRIYTAPGDFEASLIIKSNAGEEVIKVEPDNQFGRIVTRLLNAIESPELTEQIRSEIRQQANLVEEFRTRCS
ncbi:MAG: Gfo/Idh/MocA family oxidoreductase [Lachnospiraceae bacterium]|nr:Gfo/Idh/MocA family oxidoreductase [Lachnospiraceae bacterium]